MIPEEMKSRKGGCSMKPTEELVHEHEVIAFVLKAGAAEAVRMEDTGEIDAGIIEKMLDFFRTFADRCHHAKEEKHLFPVLEGRGMSGDSGPLAVMLGEHTEGRKRRSNIARLLPAAKSGDEDAIRAVAENLAAYVSLLEDHIAKENGVLFPMAERIINEADQAALEKAFARVEEQEAGQGVHEKYHQLAHELSGKS
jgi:hemerythrin-like domain-containing protein